MAITKRDLQAEVDRLNDKYCSKTGNELRIQGAYGGYQVQLTGKRRKDGKGYRGMGSGCTEITYGYQSARDTLNDLWKNEAKGYVREKVRSYEPKRGSGSRSGNGRNTRF